MIVYFNSKYIEENKVSLSIKDRGFLLGDGIFETILYKNKQLIFCSCSPTGQGLLASQLQVCSRVALFGSVGAPAGLENDPSRRNCVWRRLGAWLRSCQHAFYTMHMHSHAVGLLHLRFWGLWIADSDSIRAFRCHCKYHEGQGCKCQASTEVSTVSATD